MTFCCVIPDIFCTGSVFSLIVSAQFFPCLFHWWFAKCSLLPHLKHVRFCAACVWYCAWFHGESVIRLFGSGALLFLLPRYCCIRFTSCSSSDPESCLVGVPLFPLWPFRLSRLRSCRIRFTSSSDLNLIAVDLTLDLTLNYACCLRTALLFWMMRYRFHYQS